MAAGCPVIATNASAIPEVCGDAALACRPAVARLHHKPDREVEESESSECHYRTGSPAFSEILLGSLLQKHDRFLFRGTES